MADEIPEAEARLVALRARRQRWQSRFEAVENVRGEAVERAQCRSNVKLVDEAIAAAEAELTKVRRWAAMAEERALKEEDIVAQNATDELRKLAASCDEHAQALGVAVKDLRSKLSAMRLENSRGPSGEMVNLNMRQAVDQYFTGTVLASRPFPLSKRRTFSQLIAGWMPMLTPPSPEPSPPSPPARMDRGFDRREGEPSEVGLPRMN